MTEATNVQAHAVRTIEWLADATTTIVVPVYQRQYRWDIGGCEQLLADVRAAARTDAHTTHFIGSILSTADDDDTDPHLVLIDGQQRLTTLMLLVAALEHTLRPTDPALADSLRAVLIGRDGRTKLRPHPAWAGVFERVVRGDADASRHGSRFDDNYAFFRSQIRPSEAARIWAGLHKLEHVAISLGEHANAQQIFESLNSTGEPLRDHELIHNYVLMGLTHAEQQEIEREFWVPIEAATGEQIGAFWHHYLVMVTGREVSTAGERGVYDTFRTRFPRLDIATLRERAAQWRRFAEIYRMLLDPASAPDRGLARRLREVGTFGRTMHPLAMRLVADLHDGALHEDAFASALDDVQSLLLRRTICALPIDRLVARLCRAYASHPDQLRQAISRITPSDERTRVGLKFSELPHARYVLGRLSDVEPDVELDVAHIVPLAPGDDWSGDGVRRWGELTEDEQNAHRAVAATLGNLALLEPELAERAFDAPFPVARAAYAASGVDTTSELGAHDAWGTASIAERTERLSAAVNARWARPRAAGIDDDELTPILDATKRRGWPRGWQREFAYVEYCGEHWEVPDVKYLFNRIFARLWADARASVERYSERHGGPLYPERAWNGQWDELGPDVHLYLGWDSRYMLTAVQGVLEEAGIAGEVFVKYSYIGNAMR